MLEESGSPQEVKETERGQAEAWAVVYWGPMAPVISRLFCRTHLLKLPPLSKQASHGLLVDTQGLNHSTRWLNTHYLHRQNIIPHKAWTTARDDWITHYLHRQNISTGICKCSLVRMSRRSQSDNMWTQVIVASFEDGGRSQKPRNACPSQFLENKERLFS